MVVCYDVGFELVEAGEGERIVHALTGGLEDLCLGSGAMGFEVFFAAAG